MLHRIARGLFAVAVAAGGAQGVWARDVPTVAAASDLQFALVEVAAAFRTETGGDVRLAFGSSGNFYRQIRQGAPFELFLSADEAFVLDLADRGLTLDRGALDRGALFAIGRIVVVAPHGSPLIADGGLVGLRAALADGRIDKFAIANPDHAPYGRRAKEALKHAGLWERLEGKLVLGENVSQAAQFSMSGSAQGGIIAHSLALAPNVSKLGTFALIPAAWHRPLRQRMALLKGANDTARRFYDFVRGPRGRAILGRFGFVAPGGVRPDGAQ